MESKHTEQLPDVRSVEDRYEVVRKLGEGASAETFLVRDTQDGGRLVALKSLHVEKLDGWKYFELFEREAKTLAALRHAGVPEFIEWFASQSEQGRARFHIVQQYVEGRPLADIIDDGGMSAAEFDQLALGMLDILHYLHSRTPPVYHRDIKPSNIIVTEMGAPVLIDFGSVRTGWLEADERGSTVAGTHGYMPPEQYMGQVSARSDLYGLGATLLHVATGRTPSEFSFDDGRLTVPESLPLRPAIRRALSALLEPAPRDRPENATAARDLFIASDTTALAHPGETGLAVPYARGDITVLRTADAPRFVNLGAPPRDPRGEFRDVYRSLCPPFTAIYTGAEGVNRSLSIGPTAMLFLFVFLTLSTLGIWPLIKLIGRAERRRRATLFEHGTFTRATIVAVAAQNQFSSRVSFDFDAHGKRVRSSDLVVSADASHMVAGDVLGVLFDEQNAGNTTLVYR